MANLPTKASEITPAWLNDVLSERDDVGRVASVTAEDIGVGVGILGEVTRLSLTYEPGETGPETMISKCPSAHAENVMLCQMMGFYEREISFYQQVTDAIDVRVPACYLAAMEPGGVPFVLLLEEVTGARMIDQIEGATRDDALQIAETVARLHAPYWDNEAVLALDWLPPMNNDFYKGAQGLTEANWEPFVAMWSDRVPSEVLGWCESLTPRYGEMLDWWAESAPATMTHTDCRAENYLFGGSAGPSAVTMLDFQLMTRHVGTWDIANFLGMSVTIENRRAWEDDVISRYHETLLGLGVQDYDLDRCRRDYRFCLLHQVWAQIAISTVDPGNDRGRQLLNEFITRSFAAAADNNAGELLEHL